MEPKKNVPAMEELVKTICSKTHTTVPQYG